MKTSALLAFVLLAACGDDAPPPPPPRPAGAAPAAAGAAGAKDSKNKLAPRMHAEDKVLCPAPDKATGPECKPDTPTCEQGLYCMAFGDTSVPNYVPKYSCEPCPERDSIRHDFKDRDFQSDGTTDHGRDPFQSFVIVPRDLFNKPDKPTEVGPCTRPDQFVAPNFSYQELKLVGIVAQGTQRRVLMMAGNKGQIIKRGDCVGKEKAVVKDIGTGYITFLITPLNDQDPSKRPPEEHSVQLHPGGLEMEVPQPDLTPAPPAGPTIAPPTVAPPPPVAPPPAKKP
jgi:hypothetical protein